MYLPRLVRVAILGTVVALLPAFVTHRDTFHVHLVKSSPAANDTLHVAPKTIELWFNEAPEVAISSIKLRHLAGSDSIRVATSSVRRDANEPNTLVVDITEHVPSGRYVIMWKTTAPDGHPADGSIPFTVRTPSS
jgi:copper resistance protein C